MTLLSVRAIFRGCQGAMWGMGQTCLPLSCAWWRDGESRDVTGLRRSTRIAAGAAWWKDVLWGVRLRESLGFPQRWMELTCEHVKTHSSFCETCLKPVRTVSRGKAAWHSIPGCSALAQVSYCGTRWSFISYFNERRAMPALNVTLFLVMP